MAVKTSKVSPEEVFNSVLLELHDHGKDRFHPDLKKWHKAFYDAISEYPVEMNDFETLVREWPYIHSIT